MATKQRWELRTNKFHGSRLISRHYSLRAALRAQYAAREDAGFSRAARSQACRCAGPQIIGATDETTQLAREAQEEIIYLMQCRELDRRAAIAKAEGSR